MNDFLPVGETELPIGRSEMPKRANEFGSGKSISSQESHKTAFRCKCGHSAVFFPDRKKIKRRNRMHTNKWYDAGAENSFPSEPNEKRIAYRIECFVKGCDCKTPSSQP